VPRTATNIANSNIQRPPLPRLSCRDVQQSLAIGRPQVEQRQFVRTDKAIRRERGVTAPQIVEELPLGQAGEWIGLAGSFPALSVAVTVKACDPIVDVSMFDPFATVACGLGHQLSAPSLTTRPLEKPIALHSASPALSPPVPLLSDLGALQMLRGLLASQQPLTEVG